VRDCGTLEGVCTTPYGALTESTFPARSRRAAFETRSASDPVSERHAADSTKRAAWSGLTSATASNAARRSADGSSVGPPLAIPMSICSATTTVKSEQSRPPVVRLLDHGRVNPDLFSLGTPRGVAVEPHRIAPQERLRCARAPKQRLSYGRTTLIRAVSCGTVPSNTRNATKLERTFTLAAVFVVERFTRASMHCIAG
jgi:hypothetical protein